MQTAAKVNVAADSAQREAKFRKGLRREATNLQHNMDADQFKQFYTQQALDRRCELRHTPEVIRSLRAWSRAVEFKERCLTGSSVIVVHEAMYVDALTSARSRSPPRQPARRYARPSPRTGSATASASRPCRSSGLKTASSS